MSHKLIDLTFYNNTASRYCYSILRNSLQFKNKVSLSRMETLFKIGYLHDNIIKFSSLIAYIERFGIKIIYTPLLYGYM